MADSDYRKPIAHRPRLSKDGEVLFMLDKGMVDKDDERALCMRLVADRRLFGLCYRALMPGYFDGMPPASGVFVRGFVPTRWIASGVDYPGDIDLLVLPYESNELILSKALAVEVKVVRAKFHHQGKSPGSYGISQARALLECGIPYVAVVHLIVSDDAPPENWREVQVTRLLDESGRCEPLRTVKADLMPADLIRRSFGRLCAIERDGTLGVVAAYVGRRGVWQPEGRPCAPNEKSNQQVLDAIHSYYGVNWDSFVDTPRRPFKEDGGS